MKRDSLGLRWSDEGPSGFKLEIMDQRVLPDREVWIEIDSAEKMVECIRSLAVRGAPLIGVAAAFAVALDAALGRDAMKAASNLRAARPTAVNLMWAIDRMKHKISDGRPNAQALRDEALAIFDKDVAMCEAMGKNGAELIEEGEACLTICNTGGLATVGIGTAFAALRTAHSQGKRIHVYACETRPLLQGARLTTWELRKNGIPHTLITDGMASALMRELNQKGRKQSVWTGCDRMSRRGDFANKIGTYSLAVLAGHHRVPFYPVLPFSTVDAKAKDGSEIEVEIRAAREVQGFWSPAHEFRWSPTDTEVWNPAFDVTPADLVSAIVLDRGTFSPPEFSKMLSEGT